MGRLGHMISGRRPGIGRRPHAHETIGINWSCLSARGLQACFPLNAPAGTPQVEMVTGLRSSIFNAAPLHAADPRFGLIAMGGGNTSGSGTDRVYRFAHQDRLHPGGAAMVGKPWAASFWFKTNSTSHTPNEYYMQWTFNGGTFPGIALSFDTSNQLAFNTNGTTLGDAGYKTTMNPFDTKWHHVLFVQVPSGNPNTFDSSSAYFVDGALDSTNINGTNQPAVHATTPGDLFFLGDDQADAAANGALTDFRIYKLPAHFTEANVGTDALSFARHLYNEATRWELYLTRPAFDGLALLGDYWTEWPAPGAYGDMAVQQRMG